jgi:single-stranded-DNA-specific exonuclease
MAKIKELREALGITDGVAQVLLSRGYKDIEEAQKFVYPKFEYLYNPFDFPEMRVAVDRILHTIQQKKCILVWGHNDVDGITATALLVSVIRDLKGKVEWYIPENRDSEFRSFKDIDLIITVDCNISKPHSQVDFIVTDHHEFPENNPSSFAFINPKFGYPFPGLAGVGVAYKLAQAIVMTKFNLKPHQWFSVSQKLLFFVKVGTIADKVELVDENRVFLKLTQNIKNPISEKAGVYELIKLISSTKDKPDIGVNFLLGEETLFSELEKKKIEQDKKIEEAYKLCDKINTLHSGIILIYEERIDPNILGVCASRMVNRYGGPCVVISKRKDGILVGEGRAPQGFNFIEILKKFNHIFRDWGGHKGAVGFSIHLDNLKELERQLSLIKLTFPKEELKIDAEIKKDEITPRFFHDIELLEPFGPGNPPPLFLTKKVNKGEVSLFSSLPENGNYDVTWSIVQGRVKIKERKKYEDSTY